MQIESHRDDDRLTTTPYHTYVRDYIVPEMKRRGFAVFSGALNINIVVVRTPERVAGQFDDWLFVFELTHAHEPMIAMGFRCTADPGEVSLEEVKNPRGVARILSPQQIRSGLEIGLHKNTYPALRQAAAFRILRDANRDKIHNPPRESEETGWFGINVHAADANPFLAPRGWDPNRKIGRWSEGCIVFADGYEYATHFWTWILHAQEIWGPKFTLTVLDGPVPEWALLN